jgi:glycosyltransferase involved in cell wall biosynthesis
MAISIIIPAYNEEEMIGGCLRAITEADESDSDLEIIVVNNASTDHTADVVSKFPQVKLVNEPQKGLTRARERGRLESSGDILIYVDADTKIPKHLIRYIERKFRTDTKLVALSGPYKYHDWHWFGRLVLWMYHWTLVPLTQLLANRLLNKGSVFYGANFALRRNALERIGGFDTRLEFWSEDTQIGRRLCAEGKVRFFHRAYTYTSARRFYEEGMLRVLLRYVMNFLWDVLFHRPFTRGYQDIRQSTIPAKD